MEPSEETTVTEAKRINPLLEKLKKRVPGESFRLPSRGLFYTNGEIDSEVENGEVVVYPLTTVDELKLRSQDMLFQGTAITEVIAARVPQILKPEKLVAADVDYLLTCLRKVSYGPLLPIKHTCKHCDIGEKEFNLSIAHFITGAKEITEEQFAALTLTVDDAYTVKLKPCTFDEFIRVIQRSGNGMDSAEQVAEWLDSTLLAVIRSVDGIKDKEMIAEWLTDLDVGSKEELSDKVETMNHWGPDFSFDIVCEKCNTPDNLRTSLNPTSFFTLPSSRKTKTQ